ncbi:MAG: hypothetical protein AAF741_10950 [Bacteroidota bacterium]
MKIYYPILVSSLLFLLFSCGNDDEGILIDEREKFLGTYAGMEVCGQLSDNGNIIIITSVEGSNDQLSIQHLYNFGTTIIATVSGDNLTIESQTVGLVRFSGSGSIIGDALTIDYTVSDPFGFSGDCTASLTKI